MVMGVMKIAKLKLDLLVQVVLWALKTLEMKFEETILIWGILNAMMPELIMDEARHASMRNDINALEELLALPTLVLFWKYKLK